MELRGPTRPDPHRGPYNADAFDVDMKKQRAVCPQRKVSRQSSALHLAHRALDREGLGDEREVWVGEAAAFLSAFQATFTYAGAGLLACLAVTFLRPRVWFG